MINLFVFVSQNNGPVQLLAPSPSLSSSIPLFITAKKEAGRRPKYLYSINACLTQFSEWLGGVQVASIGLEHVEAWVMRNKSHGTRRTELSILSSFFSFAIRRGWLDENPVNRIERTSTDMPAPKILSAAQCGEILAAVRERLPVAIPFLSLALFAGVRLEENRRLTWADVDLATGSVTMSAAASKTRRRRIIHLMPAALAWLKLGGELPLRERKRRELFEIIRETLKAEQMPRDSLRHTAASFWVAEIGDAGKIATELGNSVSILQKHYLELVPKSEAGKFWNIKP